MIEYQILQALSQDEDYTRQVIPFLKQEYFQQLDHKLIYRVVDEYFDKYNALPKLSKFRICYVTYSTWTNL